MDPPRTLISFARGEVDWREVDDLDGISIEMLPSSCRIDEAADLPVVAPSLSDFATGLTRASAEGGRDWARVLLALPCVGFRLLQDHEAGERLLEAIWDLAEGTCPSIETIDLARRLAS